MAGLEAALVKVPWSLIHLPPFSHVALQALQLIAKENITLRQLSDLIGSDPAFSSEVLTIVNSPIFSARNPIRSTLQAVSLLGLEQVKGVAVTVGVRNYLGSALRKPALRQCWRHSLACALIAEELAAIALMDKSIAYTAGMMHDIGRVALAAIQPDSYAALLESMQADAHEVLLRERELFEVDHCEAGSHLVASWGLPAEFLEVACRHHERDEAGRLDMLSVIRFSCRMADTVGFAAVRPKTLVKYLELVNQLPARERDRFPGDSESFAVNIAAKINSIEIA
jgi:putative nucleotidyltransferase with HDIG domain